MNRSTLLPAVYLADQIAGDPEWFPHPVRWMGRAIQYGETVLRHPAQSETEELMSGTALAIALVAMSYSITNLIIQFAYRRSKLLGWFTEITLGWTCLAARNLHDEASAVLRALEQDNIVLARQRLARIVGRDTEHLDASEISRALIETLAESASDGVYAPLFYMTLGGVPLAMAYKATNTLDSMIGHADEQYFYFGKFAARLDDVANYLPARATALAITATSNLLPEADAKSSWRTWRQDGDKHKSPNAGQPESAMAGALQVRLGGGNRYGGEWISAPSIGQEFPAPQPEQARKAVRLTAMLGLIGIGACVIAAGFMKKKEAR